MKNNRRNFLKLSGLTGLGVAGAGALKGFAQEPANNLIKHFDRKPPMQRFNMCDYAAPRLDKVRVGIIGLGDRGPGHLEGLVKIEGVEIKALCDVRPEAANSAKKALTDTAISLLSIRKIPNPGKNFANATILTSYTSVLPGICIRPWPCMLWNMENMLSLKCPSP